MQSRSRNTLLTVVALLGLLAWQYFNPGSDSGRFLAQPDNAVNVVQAAWQQQRSGVWLNTAGRITRMLADDDHGSRHQRFILDVGSGHTVLVSHNIDLAERIPAAVGDTVSLRGRYEWNERGGVIHWTHHDPGGQQRGGWIEFDGKNYR